MTGRREDRNRIPRALVGFQNALLVTGDQKYADAWRTMIDAVNSHARDDRRPQAVPDDARRRRLVRLARRRRGTSARWKSGTGRRSPRTWRASGTQPAGSTFCSGQNAAYPEQALERDLDEHPQRLAAMRRDTTPPEKRLADNMLDYNPAATESLVQLMWGGLMPGRDGGLLNARLRYFDPDRRRAGVPKMWRRSCRSCPTPARP